MNDSCTAEFTLRVVCIIHPVYMLLQFRCTQTSPWTASVHVQVQRLCIPSVYNAFLLELTVVIMYGRYMRLCVSRGIVLISPNMYPVHGCGATIVRENPGRTV
jgi:hypothetical protein